jgi:hypothetical protein
MDGGIFSFWLFLYKNCEVDEIVINPLDILAKFGYKQDMKVKKRLSTLDIFGYMLEPNIEKLVIFFKKNCRNLRTRKWKKNTNF